MTAELQSWVQIKIHRKGFHKMWIQRLTSYQFRILFYLRGSKELSTEKTLPKKFCKGLCSGLHVATMFWSALGPSLRSQVNIVCGGSHLSFTDITGEFPTLLTSYAVWVQHWSQTFLCCQWNGVNLQATFQQLFWNYCIIIQKWLVLQLLNSAKINV